MASTVISAPGSIIHRRSSCSAPSSDEARGVDARIINVFNDNKSGACCYNRPWRPSMKIISAKRVVLKVSNTRKVFRKKGDGRKNRKAIGGEHVDEDSGRSGSIPANERAQTRISAGSRSVAGSDSLQFDMEMHLGVDGEPNKRDTYMEDLMLTDEELVALKKLLQEGRERMRRCHCENDGTTETLHFSSSLGVGTDGAAMKAVAQALPPQLLPDRDAIPDMFSELLNTPGDLETEGDSRDIWKRSSSGASSTASYRSVGSMTAGAGVGRTLEFEPEIEGSTWEFGNGWDSKEGSTGRETAGSPLQASGRGVLNEMGDSDATATASTSSRNWVEPEGCRVGEAESMGVVLHQGIFQEVWSRGRWLLGLLVLQSGSGVILQMYQDLLQDHLVVTLFLTMLVGAGGNAGNQSAIKVIRELATGEVDITTDSLVACLKEQMLVGVLLAAALASLGFVRVYATNGDLRNSVAIASSLFLIVLASVAVGTTLPFALAWRGVDPANAGTSVQVAMDLLGVGITCGICSLVYSVPTLPLHATMAAL